MSDLGKRRVIQLRVIALRESVRLMQEHMVYMPLQAMEPSALSIAMSK